MLDLKACSAEPDVVEEAVKWKTGNSSGQLLLIEASQQAPLNASNQSALIWYLGRFCERPPISAHEATDRSTWEGILINHPFAVLMSQVQEAFLRVTNAYKKPIPNLLALTEMLMLSPKCARVKQHVKLSTSSLKTAMNSFAGTFVNAGQSPPSEIIAAFRLAIYLHLRKHGWPLEETSQKLGCTNSRQLRASFNQRLGCGFSEIQSVEPQEALDIVAQLVTPGPHQPLKTLVQAAINTARERRMQKLAPTATF